MLRLFGDGCGVVEEFVGADVPSEVAASFGSLDDLVLFFLVVVLEGFFVGSLVFIDYVEMAEVVFVVVGEEAEGDNEFEKV